MNMDEGLLEISCKGWKIFSKAARATNIILRMILAYMPKSKATKKRERKRVYSTKLNMSLSSEGRKQKEAKIIKVNGKVVPLLN
jgi:hypothetical protein